jgi:putative phage-type endonuclease
VEESLILYPYQRLGDIYYYGYGVLQDHKEAVKWYSNLAAEWCGRDVRSYYKRTRPDGIRLSDDARWIDRIRIDVEATAIAYLRLGDACLNGRGVSQDYKKAVEWYRQAAELGHAESQFMLGVAYRDGKGVNQNFSKAYAWFNLAAVHGGEDAFNARAEIFDRMKPTQVSEGQRLSKEYDNIIRTGQPLELGEEESDSIDDESDPPQFDAHSRTINSGYIVVDLLQGTGEWLSWRNNGIGASDAPIIMGENPWQTVDALLREKRGLAKPFSGNAATRRGSELEPEARRKYEKIKGISVNPVCLQSTKFTWMRASIDGFSVDRRTVLEIKCGESVYSKVASTRKVPGYYRGQLQHIMSVTGLSSIDFFCYLPSRDPICLNVRRDESYIARLISAEQAFWRQVLDGKN